MSPELWVASDWPAAAAIAPPRGPQKEEGGAADRPLVPLKAGHPRTPMPPPQAGSGTPVRSPDIMLVQLQPTSHPSLPDLDPC